MLNSSMEKQMARVSVLIAVIAAAIGSLQAGVAQAEPTNGDARPAVTRVQAQQPAATPTPPSSQPQSADTQQPRKPPRIWLWTGFGG